MNRVAQHPIKAFAATLVAVGALSTMDAVMKGLVIAIGIVAVSVWRAAANFLISALLYLPRRRGWPSSSTLRIHLIRGVVVTVMAGLFFWGIGRVPLAQAIALTFIAPLIALLLAAAFLNDWATALGWLIFHERLSMFTLAGAMLIVAGSLIAVRAAAPPEIEAVA